MIDRVQAGLYAMFFIGFTFGTAAGIALAWIWDVFKIGGSGAEKEACEWLGIERA